MSDDVGATVGARRGCYRTVDAEKAAGPPGVAAACRLCGCTATDGAEEAGQATREPTGREWAYERSIQHCTTQLTAHGSAQHSHSALAAMEQQERDGTVEEKGAADGSVRRIVRIVDR